MVHKNFENHLFPINAKKSFYKGVPIVEFDYQEGKKNYVEINKYCAVERRDMICRYVPIFISGARWDKLLDKYGLEKVKQEEVT